MMKKVIAVLLFTLLAGASLPAYADQDAFLASPFTAQEQANVMDLEVIINGIYLVQMESIPTQGYLEVYSILGVKVTALNLRKYATNCTIDLPKGVYIIKAGKVARKVIVR